LRFLEAGRWIEGLSGEVVGKYRQKGIGRFMQYITLALVYTQISSYQEARLQTPLFRLEVFQEVENLDSPECFFRKHLPDFRMRYPDDYISA
jgi:hypothetical protein